MPRITPVPIAILVIALTLCFAASTLADTIVLQDGRFFTGEIVKEDARDVVFRTRIEGIWTDLRFDRRDVKLGGARAW